MKLHAILTLIVLTASLHAGSDTSKTIAPANPPAEGGWWFRAAPYGWVTAIEGDVGIGPLSAPVDISMKDTLDTLDMAFMGVFEVGYNRWSIGTDLLYAKTSQDIGAGGRLFDSFRYEQKQWLITPYIAFNAVNTEKFNLDVFAGARITILEAELTGRFAGPGEISASRKLDFADPIVGLRGQAELTDKVFFRFNGDIGGFGVNSELTWQAFAGFGYHVTDSVSIALGYRGLGIDYSEGSFSMDTVTHGPVIGLELKL